MVRLPITHGMATVITVIPTMPIITTTRDTTAGVATIGLGGGIGTTAGTMVAGTGTGGMAGIAAEGAAIIDFGSRSR
jgi:hypothetical protein